MSRADVVLAIDHGTSGVKTALITLDGDLLATRVMATSVHHTPDGGVEQDPNEWWAAFVAGARAVLAETALDPARVAAVACSSTYSTTVAAAADGTPVTPALTWLDARGAPLVRERMAGWPSIQGYGLRQILRFVPRTGGGPTLSGKDDLAHVLWWRAERPEIYRATRWFLSSKDWWNLRLTGLAAASFDSATLFWITDNRRIDDVRYDDGLLRALGLDRDRFAPLRRSTDLLGPVRDAVADEVGVPRGTPVVVGSPDLQSACVGSGAVRDFDAHLYLGTSSWILTHVPFKKTDPFHTIASLPSALPGRWFAANEQEMAGGCVEHLLTRLVYPADALTVAAGPDDAYARLDALASAAPPGARGVIYLPWLNGEKTPVDDETLRAGFVGMGLDTDRADLGRAVLEGVACNTRWVLGHLERFLGRHLDRVRVIGGGAQSDLWCQVHADVWDRTLLRVEHPRQANARGAAFLAALALGRLTVDRIPERVPVERTFTPDRAHRRTYDELFDDFLDLGRRLGPFYRRRAARKARA